MTLDKGTLLEGRYRIEEVLGQGGMGFVYRALDESLGVEVAVKENLFTTNDYARQFRMEAVILAGIRHPNLPRVTDHFVIDNMGQYLVMDFVEGYDLRQHLEKYGPISEEEAIRIGTATCDALTYLHSRKPPILHRDIKLSNIKIAKEGQVFLVDFGLAKMGWAHEETMAGARAMTPGYSPPEQYGTGRTDPRSDVYSLGATLYAALTGNIPEDSLLRSVDGLMLTPLQVHRPDVSRRLASVIEKALETTPSKRYQTAAEFKKALLENSTNKSWPVWKKASEIKPIAAAGGGEAANPLPGRRPVPVGLLGGGIFVIILITAGVFWFGRGGKPAVPAPTAAPSATPIQLAGQVTASPEPSPAQTLAAANLPPTLTTSPTASQPPTNTVTATTSPTLLPAPTSSETPAATDTSLPTATPPSPASASPTPTSAQAASMTPSPGANSQASVTPQATPLGGGHGQVAYAAMLNNVAQIMLVNADGTDSQALTNVPQGACNFDWSPDGKQIVFVSPCQKPSLNYPNSSLYLLDVETGKIGLPPFKPGGDFDPVWSPDGKKIAFTSLRDGSMQIYLYNLDDSSLTRLTTPGNMIQARYPAWSPDSRQIAYTNLYSGLLMINVMAANGSNKHQVVLSGGSFSEYAPAWSPDGSFLIFSRTNSNLSAPSSLVRYDFLTNITKYLPIPLPGVDANFSPDGSWIAYESTDMVKRFINICQVNSAKPVHLITSLTSVFDPAWRPAQ